MEEVRLIAEARLPTGAGDFMARVYETSRGTQPLVLLASAPSDDRAALVRIHSECLTGDVFGSRRCDCGAQLAMSLQRIGRVGGILIYLRQEGRGIGLANKLRAYALQEVGHDTVDANLALGFQADQRDYGAAVAILRELGVARVRLLTNNPDKVASLESGGIAVVERVPIVVPPTPESEAYLRTKQLRLGHLLGWNPEPARTDSSPRVRPIGRPLETAGGQRD